MRRLYVGGLGHSVSEKDLKDRFGKFGDVQDVELRTRKDDDGVPYKTFGYININISEADLKKCLTVLNKSKWKGGTLQIEAAKTSFLQILAQERQEAEEQHLQPPAAEDQIKKQLDSLSKAGVDNFTMKAAVPGTEVPGHKDWVVSKFGRVLPVMQLRCQKGNKARTLKYDPSKFSHNIRKLDRATADQPAPVTPVTQLTWEVPGGDDDISKKRRGEFPPYKPPRPKKSLRDNSLSAVTRTRLVPTVQLTDARPSTNGFERPSARRPAQRKPAPFIDSGDDSDGEIRRLAAAQSSSQGALWQVAAAEEEGEDNLEVVTFDYLMKSGPSRRQRRGGPDDEDEDDYDSADTDELLASRKPPPTPSQDKGTLPAADHVSVKNTSRKRETKKKGKAVHTETCPPSSSDDDDDEVEEEEEMMKTSQTVVTAAKAAANGLPSSSSEEDEDGCDATEEDEHEVTSAEDVGKTAAIPVPHSESSSSEEDEEDEDNSDSSDTGEVLTSGKPPPTSQDKRTLPAADHLSMNRETKKKSNAEEEEDDDRSADAKHLVMSVSSQKPGSSSDSQSKKKAVKSKVSESESSEGDEEDEDEDEEESEDDDEEEDESAESCSDSDYEAMFSNATCLQISLTDLQRLAEESQQTSETTAAPSILRGSADRETDLVSACAARPPKKGTMPEEILASIMEDDGSSSEDEKAKKKKKRKGAASPSTPVLLLPAFQGTKTLDQGPPHTNDCHKRHREEGEEEEGRGRVVKKHKLLSEEEQQKKDNVRRLAAIQQRLKETEEHKRLIQGALANLDTPTPGAGKHIVFGSDEEEEEDEDKQQSPSKVTVTKKKSLFEDSQSQDEAKDDEASANENKSTKKKGSVKLFGGSSDEEGGDDEEEDGGRFDLRPQFEGRAGHKLMELQSRFGTDDRFRLDSRFLEEDEGKDEEESERKRSVTEEDETLEEERKKNLSILQNVLGSSQQICSSSSKTAGKAKTFRDVSALHYDPSREDHAVFETKPDETKESKSARRKKREEAQKLPEVSKEIYFDVSGDLKAVFGQTKDDVTEGEEKTNWDQEEEEARGGEEQEPTPLPSLVSADPGGAEKEESSGFKFSFFGDDAEAESVETAEYKVESIQAPKVSWQQDPRFQDSSSEEEEEDDQEEDEEQSIAAPITTKEETPSKSGLSFFFYPDDSRLTEGPRLFCRPSQLEEQREQWEETRSTLRQEYRKKHKDARRKLLSSMKS